jgi:hypothetical protein
MTWHKDNLSYTRAMTITKSEETFGTRGYLIIDIYEQLQR